METLTHLALALVHFRQMPLCEGDNLVDDNNNLKNSNHDNEKAMRETESSSR